MYNWLNENFINTQTHSVYMQKETATLVRDSYLSYVLQEMKPEKNVYWFVVKDTVL